MPLHSNRARKVNKRGKDHVLLTPRASHTASGNCTSVFLKYVKIRDPDKHQEGTIDNCDWECGAQVGLAEK